ncbi:MAG: hypothetical protein H0W58_02410 [Acidobacteria bacterium]|jgi:hypothetical protein|nr:hypothetical protein [Acidobacteriota bacterium]
MAAPFNSGKLPEPLRKPSGSIDEMAAALAKQVSARDEQSVPALLTAILTAGFGLRDRDGSVLQTVQPGQGLAFNAWEVAAMAKMYGESRSVQLTYLTDGLKSIPELKQTPLDTVLLDGIRKHAQGDQPLLRFWARFIVELGRQQDKPYDILGAVDPKSVRLDAIQSALILRRLIGDFYGFAERGKQASIDFSVDDLLGVGARPAWIDGKQQTPLFIRASWSGYDSPQFVKVRVPKSVIRTSQGSPCGSLGTGDAATILDAAATVITSGWGGLLGLGQPGGGAEKYGKFLNIANIILAYAEFIATYAALETEITVENSPLVRTKNSRPGERRQLTATVKMNTGGWDNINCLRTALNVATGLDFSLIKDGSLEGVEVNWNLNEGGAGDSYSNRTGATSKHQIVGFAGNNSPRIQSAGTNAGIAGRGGTPVGNLTRTKTNSEGKAQIYLEGSPKIPYVVEPAATVMKQAIVSTTIKMKGGDIKGDAVDVMGQAMGGVSGLVTMPLELLYRTDWASSGYLVVPVEDHESCTGQWRGTITYTSKYKYAGSGEGANNKSYWNEEVDYTATIELSDKRDEYGKPLAFVKAQASEIRERGGQGITGCYRINNQLQKVSGTAEDTASVTVSVRPDGRYGLSYSLPLVLASGTYTVTGRRGGTCRNPFDRPVNQNDPIKDHKISPGFAIDEGGMIDPKRPNVLAGSKTVTKEWQRDGQATVTVSWNLVSCGRR